MSSARCAANASVNIPNNARCARYATNARTDYATSVTSGGVMKKKLFFVQYVPPAVDTSVLYAKCVSAKQMIIIDATPAMLV